MFDDKITEDVEKLNNTIKLTKEQLNQNIEKVDKSVTKTKNICLEVIGKF